MALSAHAVNGNDSPRTIRIVGNLYGHQPLTLIDSGSSSNFISEQMATAFPNWSPLQKPVQVRVANGASIHCTHELKQQQIYIQGHSFLLDLKILPQKCYDVIIGMDCLEMHNPMKVHW
jgi:hypothetical protein